tara:strand:+ start:64 stop:441 length:378 start_codon:yes stop_codon:yes gene_type:complete
MINVNFFLFLGFHSANLILIIFYLFPGSILGCFFYDNCHVQPQITGNFLISSNHFYAFILLSALGVLAYEKKNKIRLLFRYLLLISFVLESLHFIIPNRGFEFSDLFGNIFGVILIMIFYKIKTI